VVLLQAGQRADRSATDARQRHPREQQQRGQQHAARTRSVRCRAAGLHEVTVTRGGGVGVVAGTAPLRRPPSRQCAKWRAPVRYIVTPAAFAASITGSSRTEPPGWTTARTPASVSTSSPSGNGKNASDAATAPAARSPARLTARRDESTRLTCPM